MKMRIHRYNPPPLHTHTLYVFQVIGAPQNTGLHVEVYRVFVLPFIHKIKFMMYLINNPY